MQVKKSLITDTQVKLTIIADETALREIKGHVLTHFRDEMKLPGFRQGKAPLNLVEKKADQSLLQTRFLEEAVQEMYSHAVRSEDLRPVDNPEITLTKFVPFTTLEFDAVVSVIGEITLPDYYAFKRKRSEVKITNKDIDEVLASLQSRMAESKDVDMAAAQDSQVIIDFHGTDKDGKDIEGADGKDYPLILGSNSFIPGFEDKLVGMKAGDLKSFTLQFPEDYGAKHLAGAKVTFDVTVKKVQQLIKPDIDDEFAAKVGPFKTVDELKSDIKKQLIAERQNEADREFESNLVRDITAKSKVSVPEVLLDDQVDRMKRELNQNLVYRGQTLKEFYASEGTTEEAYDKEILRPQAEERVKAGLVLSEIADKEKLEVTKEELEIRIKLLKGQYRDETMQAELDKPENRREIASRILTEKTINRLTTLAEKK